MKTRTEWERELARPYLAMEIVKKTSRLPMRSSCFGAVTLLDPTAGWPIYDGSTMWPICQFVIADLPVIPGPLSDIAMIQVFMHPEYWEYWNEGWEIRTYKSLDNLKKPNKPKINSSITTARIAWKQLKNDLPMYSDLPDEMSEGMKEDWCEDFPAAECTKIGGWPHPVQQVVGFPEVGDCFEFEYVFQIGSESEMNWMWGDAGIAHVGRGTGEHRDKWSLDWQCS